MGRDEYVDPYSDGLDKAKQAPFSRGDMKCGHLFEATTYSVRFPTYREEYVRNNWAQINAAIKELDLKTELNLIEGTMSVETTRKTWDPYSIIKARDFLTMVARSVDLDHASKILEDDVYYEIMDIYKLCTGDDEKFRKRRQRLIGPSGATLKAIEMLSNCYVMVQGKTVCIIGSLHGIKDVKDVVADCMKNIHPVFDVQKLMVKNELKNDDRMSDKDWTHLYPQLEKTHTGHKKPHKVRNKGEYNPFPEPQKPSRLDKQMESGEYFMVGAGKRKADHILEAQKERKDAVREAEKSEKRARTEEMSEKKRLKMERMNKHAGETKEERNARKAARKAEKAAMKAARAE
ncbi:KH domain [Carpediemonas membranifera]|uniref:KRR1 small subunit processome component n=1 Tax=Carpediemonas membranifera TaxID=201153 RepID=A0A8J6B6P4_9EUKA|nr:KH domain [Carpediemonas membranifera]|eukprot:KAG9396798.1 KH domain [Carpediemonas membranifera]